MSINHQQQLSIGSPEFSRNPRENQGKNFGRWSPEEQLKYIAFLDFFKDDLKISQKRKYFKIFKMMGEFINTRDGIQCRSHHMKQLKSFKKVHAIIKKFKKNLSLDSQAAYDLCAIQISNQYSRTITHPQSHGSDSQKNAQNAPQAPILGSEDASEFQNRNLVPNSRFSEFEERNRNHYFGIYFIPSVASWGGIAGGFPYITYSI